MPIEIDLNELFDQLVQDCLAQGCKGPPMGCWNCRGGKILTPAGIKLLEFVKGHLEPDPRGGWDLEQSRLY